MRYAEHRLPYKSNVNRWRFWNVGDIHWGAKSFDQKSFRKTVDIIAKDDYSWWFGTGDWGEFINVDDKRFDPENIMPELVPHLQNLPVAQCRGILNEIKPIIHKCLGGIGGNHDDYIKKKYFFDPLDYIINAMNDELEREGKPRQVVNLGYGKAIIRVTLQRIGEDKQPSHSILFNIAHGSGGGEYPGGNLNRLVRISANDDADVLMRGHVHKMISYLLPVFHYPRKGKLGAQAQHKALLTCGSYYKTYQENVTSYAEQKDLAPVETGSNWVDIKIEPLRMRVGGETALTEGYD